MSNRTRCQFCGHTPNYDKASDCEMYCPCHVYTRRRTEYPEPGPRPKWPRHTAPQQQVEIPLYVRSY